MTIKVLAGQSIYDIAVQYYGSVDLLSWLLEDNKLDLNSDLTSGQQLEIRDIIRKNDTVKFYAAELQSINNADEIQQAESLNNETVAVVKRNSSISSAQKGLWIVHDGQSIWDVAVMFYGSPDKINILLQDNPELNLSSSLLAGQIVKVRLDVGNVEKFDIQTDQIIINNADNIERILGELRIFVRTIGAEKQGNDGFVLIDVYGGELPYTFLWSNNQTTQNLIGVSSALYNVTVTDGIGTEVNLEVFVPLEIFTDLLVDNPGGNYIITNAGQRILVNS